jgi:radical SAM protein with 4Fe4S-binding SPASM domain
VLDLATSMALVEQAADMGIRTVAAYPRRGDVSLECNQYSRLFAHARSLGLHTKTTSSCVNPAGLIALLPHIDQLTLSIDGFDASSFARFRPPWLLKNVLHVLDYLAQHRPPALRLSINVVVTRSFLASGGVETLIQQAITRNQFQRINMLEILPGDSHTYAHERLGPPEMEYLITLKQRYKGQIKLTIPRWKAGAPDLPSCALGKKFLVVGPEGHVAACVLLLYGGLYTTNIFAEPSLAAAWAKVQALAQCEPREALFTAPATFPLESNLDTCRDCDLFQARRCFGGCIARVRWFGHAFEIARQCYNPHHSA